MKTEAFLGRQQSASVQVLCQYLFFHSGVCSVTFHLAEIENMRFLDAVDDAFVQLEFISWKNFLVREPFFCLNKRFLFETTKPAA